MPWDHPTLLIRCLPIDGEPSTIGLTDQPIIVGSSIEAGFHVASRMVSRHHFQIARRDQDVYVTDLNSRNGTFLNGQRLESGQEIIWRLGDVLRIPDVEFELSLPQAFVPTPKGDFHLSASPSTVKVPSTVKLTLLYHGTLEQYVTFQAYSLTPGFEVGLTPNGGTVTADTPFLSEAHIKKVKPLWRGGQFRVRFAANAMSGLLDTAEVTIKVRPRYELLLLLLLLLLVPVMAVMAAMRPSVTIASVPTSTLRTEEPTLPITVTRSPSQIPIPTATPLPTLTSVTVTLPVCANQCAAYGWPNYVIQAGDTLYSLAQGVNTSMSLVQQVNCLADPNQMTAGSTICLPVVPIVTTIPPSPTCAGFRATSPPAFPQGTAVFYWDAPSEFIPTSYRLDIYNADTGAWMTGQDISGATTATADVSWNTLGRYEMARWQIQALVNGVAVCSDAWLVSIEWPTPRPEDPQPAVVDLVVSSITATGAWDVESQCTDFAVDVRYTVTNRGNSASGTFASNSYYGADAEVFAAQCGLFNATQCPETALGGGQSTTFSHTQQMSFGDGHPAAIDVFASADIEGYGSASNQCRNAAYCNVAESNENNNQSATISVPVPSCPRLPDLVIPRIEPDYSRAECVIGAGFTAPVTVLALIGPAYTRVRAQQIFNYRVPVLVTVQNQGDVDAPNGVPVEIETIAFESGWTVQANRTTTIVLPPGQEETIEGWIILSGQNLYSGRGIVNIEGNFIEESSLDNNVSPEIDLQLVNPPSCGDPPPPPDLTVVITSGPTAGCGIDGCFVALDFTVTNIGGSDANTPSDIVVEVNENPVVSITLDNLPAGGNQPFSETIPADDSCVNPGCAVTVRVDAGDTIAESNEDNNSASGSTAPPPPVINMASPPLVEVIPAPPTPEPITVEATPMPILPEPTVTEVAPPPIVEIPPPLVETLPPVNDVPPPPPDEVTLTPEVTAETVETALPDDEPAAGEPTAAPPLTPTDTPVDPTSL